ncbi:hypothetical protein BC835DRAFT_1408606 [Cytidiella melzeri]|nr:hypothetical protein BC835DRAFT_1408606 [Cytidiella melzeri]
MVSSLVLPILAFLRLVQQPAAPHGIVGYYNPTVQGGSWLDDAGDGFGEPLNVVISGLSAPHVLTDDGFLNFAHSEECFDLHLGNPQSANLGDGHGWVNQTVELRQDYGSPDLGTCLESLIGGNHLRLYRQNGSLANSGALFLAVSQEEPVTENHDIEPNGYNIGRDALVKAAVGVTKHNGVSYSTTAENLTGVMVVGSDGVNHGIDIDGNAILLTVRIN